MPMKTMFDSRPSCSSRMTAAAARTCSRISAVVRFLVSPPCPVAQNGQAMPHPACDEMHSVLRFG